MLATEKFSLLATIGSENTSRQWALDRLPPDLTSVENAVIFEQTTGSGRSCYFVDPQGHGITWLQNHFKEKLKVLYPTAGYTQTLEPLIQQGQPVLLANCSEELDP